MINREEINRMRWAARRGMLELDLVLEPFVDQCYADLDDPDRRRFQALMRCEDQDLFAWLLRREQPVDKDTRVIVGRILEFTRRPPADR
ncbi:MAG: succinate dehydrogenase assembly factor 2 [Halioglobus sp.]|nr:succinate dehydrogenase assembly factor 2 [Halioglobus sp.]